MDKKTLAHQFGIRMEEEAKTWFLGRMGGRCLAARQRWKGGELDLIFEIPDQRGGLELVFVEVRARRTPLYGSALETLGTRKLRRLARSATLYLARYRGQAQSVRFDLLAWQDGTWTHHPNLWPLPPI